MLKYVIQNIKKRKVRTFLTILAITVCIQMFTVINSIIEYTISDLEEEMSKYAGQMYVKDIGASGTSGQEFPPMSSTISSDIGNEILSDIDSAINADFSTPVIFKMIAGPTAPNMPPEALAVGVQPGKERAYTGEDVKVESGELQLQVDENQVVLGATAAIFYDVNQAGETIEISGNKFEVIGILASGNRVTDSIVLAPIEKLQSVFSLESTYSAVLITAQTIESVNTIAESITSQYEGIEIMTQGNIVDNISQTLEGTKLFMGTILITVVAVAIIVIVIVMTLTIMERTKEIGILRALGAQKNDVFKSILFESLCMSLFGGFLGVIGGYSILRFAFSAPDFMTFKIAIISISMSILVGVLSSLYPSLKAINIQPQEALRYE